MRRRAVDEAFGPVAPRDRGANALQAQALVRLLRLASPALPIGAYSYSSGLEAAAEQRWLADEASIGAWISQVLEFNLVRYEGPMLCRLHDAWKQGVLQRVGKLNAQFLAARETAELRAESCRLGEALRNLLAATGELQDKQEALHQIALPALPTVYAFAAVGWGIPCAAALSAYLFGWTENQVNAATKTMQLGYLAAQRILVRIVEGLPEQVTRAERLADYELSNFSPGLALASCHHESQDARMFRS